MRSSFVKKTVVLAAVAATSPFVVAQTAPTSSVQLYGIVDVGIRHTNNRGPAGNPGNGSLTEVIGGGMSQSRWGINVTEDMGGGLKALVNLENRFLADTGTTPVAAGQPFFQQSWVGLQGGLGRLTMGRQYNMLFDLVTSTYASFPYSPYMEAYKPEIGMSMGARANNMLKYMAEVGPWRASLQYSFDENNVVDATTPPASVPAIVGAGVNKTMGGYLRYSADGLSAGAGYLRTTLPGGTDVDAWTVGGSYRTGPWYVNLGYGVNKRDAYSANPVQAAADVALLSAYWTGSSNGGFLPGDADKRDMVKVGFGYQITPQMNIGAHYFRAKQSGSATGTANGKADFFVTALDYAFSKRTDAYVAIDHTKVSGGTAVLLDANGARDRTGYTVGLRHRF